MVSDSRGGNGRYSKSLSSAERDAEACRLRVRAMSYAQIAKQLGYADEGHAYQGVSRALRATVEEPAAEVRKTELERLNNLYEAALAILERMHVTVSQGRVVYLGDLPLADDAPALAAIDRLLKIQERRARLLGLDAPVKHEVRNVDALDAEIEQLVARLATGSKAEVAPEAPAGARPV